MINEIMENGKQPISPIQDHGYPSFSSVISEGTLYGLTKREYFAGLAMQGMVSRGGSHSEWVAHEAVKYADELLKQLE